MLPEKPWRLEQVLQLVVGLFASILAGMIVMGWLGAVSWLQPAQVKFLNLVVGTLSFHGVGLFLTYRLLREHGITWDDAFGLRAPGLTRTMSLAVLVGLVVLPVAWSLGQLSARTMELLHLPPVVQSPVQMLQGASNLPMKLAIGCLAVIVAPLVEELVFRGLIYPALKQHGLPKLALWGTSLLFAALHSNLMTMLPLTFLALVLTLLYEATGNLLAPIVAHSLFNFVNFFWVIAQGAGYLVRFES